MNFQALQVIPQPDLNSENRYRLLFWQPYSPKSDVLAIFIASSRKCFVRAISQAVDVSKNIENRHRPDGTRFSEPMTIEEIRTFVGTNMASKVGSDIDRCVGLFLEDGDDGDELLMLFNEPVIASR